MTLPARGNETAPLAAPASPERIQTFRILIAEGPLRGHAWESGSADRAAVGSHPSNDVVLEDDTVSRFHCEIVVDAAGARVRDLGSRNGTFVDGHRVVEIWVRHGSVIRLGRAAIQFQYVGRTVAVAASARSELGSLVGASLPMRAVFGVLERAAASDVTVLLEGETGTGKEGAAKALHEHSARKAGPFVVVDCSAIHGNLVESELFGHERGAFTGAIAPRAGAFEEAAGGTLFLDEIGELPLDMQPKLLRALESREIRRIGSNERRAVDLRVVAATHRDLRQAVNQGAFRSDLYFRLAVVRVTLPPLRERLDDLPLLVSHLLDRLGAPPAAKLRDRELVARLARSSWPGNVRELRNYLERCLVLEEELPVDEAPPTSTSAPPEPPDPPDPPETGPYAEARRRALDRFERRYLESIVARHHGKIAEAAREAGIDRVSLYRMLRRHGLGRAT